MGEKGRERERKSPTSHFQLIQHLTGERDSSNNWGSTAVGEGKAPRQD